MGGSYGKFAGVYDTLMRDVDYAGWAAYLMALLEDRGGAHTVLDCACGTGEFAIRLAREGYSVAGLDASGDMLRIAQDKARAQGLIDTLYLSGYARGLSLHRPVDALLCACDGVNYLTGMADVRAFFRSAAAAIKPGGIFLFDISSRY
jgi:ubiquinone/menaquinone biosynthesis C-methylase UbiE